MPNCKTRLGWYHWWWHCISASTIPAHVSNIIAPSPLWDHHNHSLLTSVEQYCGAMWACTKQDTFEKCLQQNDSRSPSSKAYCTSILWVPRDVSVQLVTNKVCSIAMSFYNGHLRNIHKWCFRDNFGDPWIQTSETDDFAVPCSQLCTILLNFTGTEGSEVGWGPRSGVGYIQSVLSFWQICYKLAKRM